MCEDIETIIRLKFNINPSEVIKSDESTDGNVYIITADNQIKFVIKVYADIEHAELMTNLHSYVNKIGLKAPTIICNSLGQQITEYEGKFAVCYSFANGVKLKATDFTEKRIESVAEYLKLLHGVHENDFYLSDVPYEITSERKSVLHFDITKHNIFVDGDDICFIDFDDAKFGPSVCDVAIALTNLFISKANGADINGMKLFVKYYYGKNAELRKTELPVVKEAAMKWLKSIIDNPNFDDSIRSGLENKLKIWGQLKLENLT